MEVQKTRTNNKRFAQGLLAVLLVIGVQNEPILLAAQAVHNTPKDSFLTTQVNSINDLVDEIYHNAAVRTRYAELYHMPTSSVAGYMKNNLEIGHLAHPYHHAVYCVTPRGVIFTAEETLHSGEKVFALKNGRPVLRWACGNPFTASLPANSPRTAMAGTVIFTGAASRHPKAALLPNTGKHAKLHRLPIQEASSQTLQATNVIVPTEKVSPYVATLPSTPVLPAVGGPTNIIVPAIGSFTAHVPLTPFLAALPVAFLGTSHSSSPAGSPAGTTGGTTTGGTTTGGTTTGGTTTGGTTTGGATTGGTTTGGTTTGGTTTGGTTTGGTTTGGTPSAPEPSPLTTWSLAGLFLAIGAAVGKRRRQAVRIKA